MNERKKILKFKILRINGDFIKSNEKKKADEKTHNAHISFVRRRY